MATNARNSQSTLNIVTVGTTVNGRVSQATANVVAIGTTANARVSSAFLNIVVSTNPPSAGNRQTPDIWVI